MAHGPDTEELFRRLANVRQHYETSEPTGLYIYGLRITSLPELPSYLTQLWCSHTQITELPPLPDSLRRLDCANTQITNLPSLPPSLELLSCHNTQITELPPLPGSLKKLVCSHTQITELPPLPSSLSLLIDNNCPNLLIKPMEGETIEAYEERWKPIREEQKKKCEELVNKKRIQERCLVIKEELMATAWHPRRVERLLDAGYSFEEVFGD